MLLKFKNKHLMAMDKMLKDGEATGGIIDSLVLDPKEAYGLLLELVNLGRAYISDIIIKDSDGVDVTNKELIWNGAGLDKNKHVKTILSNWYKTHYKVTYKDIPVMVVKPKLELPPPEPVANQDAWDTTSEIVKTTGLEVKKIEVKKEKPKPPPNKIIREGALGGFCDKCGSSMKTKWFIFDGGGCIQPECDNYWKKV
jgi:hypothetical protein